MEAAWLTHPEFPDFVQKAWCFEEGCIAETIDRFTKAVRDWNQTPQLQSSSSQFELYLLQAKAEEQTPTDNKAIECA